MQIKNRQQLLAIVAISAVGLFAADKLVRAPLTASWQQRARQISALRDKVADGRNWVQNSRAGAAYVDDPTWGASAKGKPGKH